MCVWIFSICKILSLPQIVASAAVSMLPHVHHLPPGQQGLSRQAGGLLCDKPSAEDKGKRVRVFALTLIACDFMVFFLVLG